MVVEDEMTRGDLMAFIAYLAFLVAPLIEMGNIGSQFTEAFAGLDRTKELMSVPKESENPLRTRRLEDVRGNLAFKGVHFSYQEGAEVLSDISFEAPSGSVTALVGSSGSGKTTIAGLAASFLTPDKGVVELDGIDLSRVTLDSYRSRLGVVLQDDFLYEGTIRENILFGQPKASEADLLSAVKAAHVKEFADRLEDGLDTLIGERGVKLSGGQRQRVAIARALLAGPQNPDPRRSHLKPGHRERNLHSGKPERADPGAHHPGHRPSLEHHSQGRPDPCHRERTDRGARNPRSTDRQPGPLPPALYLPGADLKRGSGSEGVVGVDRPQEPPKRKA